MTTLDSVDRMEPARLEEPSEAIADAVAELSPRCFPDFIPKREHNMSDASHFVGDIPRNYEEGLGPVLFEPFARDLAMRASAAAGADVLELAAGTGIATRLLRDKLPASARLTASDLNAPMLALAQRKFRAEENVAFEPADAMKLPFGDETFDLAICQFGVMFFPDKRGAFRETRRVLRSGGRYIFNSWGPMSANPFSALAYDTGAHFFPDDPPNFYRVPFSYADPGAIGADAAVAGFADIDIETVRVEQDVLDWTRFAHGIVFGNPLIAEIQERGGVSAEDFKHMLIATLRARFGEEPTRMPLEAVVVSCRAP